MYYSFKHLIQEKPNISDENPTRSKRQKLDQTSADLSISENPDNSNKRQKKQKEKSKKGSKKTNFVKGVVSGSVGTAAAGLFAAMQCMQTG